MLKLLLIPSLFFNLHSLANDTTSKIPVLKDGWYKIECAKDSKEGRTFSLNGFLEVYGVNSNDQSGQNQKASGKAKISVNQQDGLQVFDFNDSASYSDSSTKFLGEYRVDADDSGDRYIQNGLALENKYLTLSISLKLAKAFLGFKGHEYVSGDCSVKKLN